MDHSTENGTHKDPEDGAEDDVRQRLYKHLSETEYRVIHLLPGGFLDEI